MTQITIIDDEQTISFQSDQDVLLSLVAGCSVDPANLDELLIATEIYQRGFTAILMAELMEFDKTLRQRGVESVHEAIKQAKTADQSLEMTFQVVDPITEDQAFHPKDRQLVIIDLVEKVIYTSPGIEIATSDQIPVNTASGEPKPTVTYILPKNWGIQTLHQPPSG